MMHEDKQKILDMVANGSITPEEAIMLLECLEDSSNPTPEKVMPISMHMDAPVLPPLDIHKNQEKEKTEKKQPGSSTDAAKPADASGTNNTDDKEPTQSQKKSPPKLYLHTELPENLKNLDNIPSVIPHTDSSAAPTQAAAVSSHGNSSGIPHKKSSDFCWENEPELPTSFHRYSYTIPEADIHNIKIAWVNGPMVVKAYGGKDILITEYSRDELSANDSMYITVINGTLNIKWDQKDRIMSLARLIGRSFLSKHLVVEVPYEMAGKLSSLNCSGISGGIHCTQLSVYRASLSTTSGKIFASGLNCETLNINSVSGSINMNGCSAEMMSANTTSGAIFSQDYTANSANHDSVSGRITTSGKSSRLRSNSVSGQINAVLLAMPGSAKLETVSGRIILTMPENEGFTVKYSSMSGILQSDFPLSGSVGQKNGKAVYGNGITDIELATLSARMQLKVLERA